MENIGKEMYEREAEKRLITLENEVELLSRKIKTLEAKLEHLTIETGNI